MELPFYPAVAGCFVMIDFRKHLRSQTFEDELSLFQSLCDKGVMLTPGQHVLCQQPGWMRLVFSCDKKELIEGAFYLNSHKSLRNISNANIFQLISRTGGRGHSVLR
ncbi:hypothetical protein ANCCAN_01833 [Ancylostoma caninum]|uniref:Aminotransferase class I/classII domain-containing protein n=1 Tax=Ancylostoma caninum TaxID=29170 RepID=A0A368H9Y1_ANCCA|nr:hypothetical protein ANCCAN_01833 [Ancylostoma caninum]